jgi:peptidoglycan/LPS O-acetylase OafA/YrhL
MSSPYSLTFRPDVQGLRAIAVALVVFAHAKLAGFAGGFVGVDVFFVISGYLITGLLVRERLSSGTIHYGQFLARRLRRLLPALLVMLVVVLVAANLLLSGYETRMQTGSALFAATWTSNFFFAFSDFSYFDALTARDLFLHTWSLAVEEQFYLIWPWLAILAFAQPTSDNGSQYYRRQLLLILTIVFVASLGLCLYWAATNPVLGFYMMPARGWQFALGSLVYVVGFQLQQGQVSESKFAVSAAVANVSAVVGLAMILASAVLLHADLTYPGFYALFPSVGTALVIAAGQGGTFTAISKWLNNRFIVWIGDRSYSLYLWHWPVLILGDSYGLTDSAVAVLLLVVISVVLAAMSYRFVELPFWKGQFSKSTPRVAILVSVLTISLTATFAQNVSSWVHGSPTVVGNEQAHLARTDAPAIYQQGANCDTWYFSAELTPCETSAGEATRTAVLIGDSIGAQWVELFFRIYSPPDWRFIVLTKSSCAIADEEYYYERLGGNYDICTEWRESALDYIADVKPDVLFVGSSSTYRFTADQWREGTSRVLSRLTAAARDVVLIPGTPALTFDGPSCVESPYRFSFRLQDSRRECEEALEKEQSKLVAGYLMDAAGRFENAHVLNLNDLVCPENRCAAQKHNGLVVFRDSQHLTNSFVLAQVPEVSSLLAQMRLGEGPADETQKVAAAEP